MEHASKLIDGHHPEGMDPSKDHASPSRSRNSLHDDPRSSPRGWSVFQHLVETELGRELGLIGPYPAPASTTGSTSHGVGWGMEQDMHVISGIEVHEVFKRSGTASAAGAGAGKQEKEKGGRRVSGVTGSPTSVGTPPSLERERAPSVAQEKRKTLADYVNFARMKVVRDNCQRSYGMFPSLPPLSRKSIDSLHVDDHQNQYSAISNDVFALQSATDQIARSIEGLEAQVDGEVAEMVGHAEAIADEARALVLEDPGTSDCRVAYPCDADPLPRCALAE